MKFKLKSDFAPTGDQPQAIETLTQSCLKGSANQTLMGVTGSGKTFTLANVIQNLNLPTLIISHNKTLAGQLYQEFRDFFPENAVSYFVSYYDYYQPEAYLPSTDTYIEKETNINDEIDKLRLGTTANLLTRPDVIVVASVSCIYNLGSPVEYGRNFLELIEGQLIERDTLITRLIDMQYSRSDYELRRGVVRVRGDVITVWPADLSHALKISFIENRIEAITSIDPISGKLVPNAQRDANTDDLYGSHLPRYVIYPAKHYQTNRQDMDSALKAIKKDLAEQINYFKSQGKVVEAYRIGQRVKHDLEMLAELGYVNGIENYSRYFDGREPGDPPFSLLDYFHYNAKNIKNTSAKLPEKFLTIIDESHITLPQLRGMYHGDRARKQTLIDYGFRLPSALDNRPLQFPEIQSRLPISIYASATPDEWEIEQSKGCVAEQLIRPTGLVDPDIEIRPIDGQIQDLVKEIIKRKAVKERVLVTTLTKKTAEALTDYLNDQEKILSVIKNFKLKIENFVFPKVQYLHADVETLDRQDILDNLRAGDFDVVVGINLLYLWE